MTQTRPPASNAVLCAIFDALAAATPQANGIRISIESTPRRISNNEGSVSYMKALCWNLMRDGEYIGVEAPTLAVVHGQHTPEAIRRDLETYFPGYDCIVDNDISVNDD